VRVIPEEVGSIETLEGAKTTKLCSNVQTNSSCPHIITPTSFAASSPSDKNFGITFSILKIKLLQWGVSFGFQRGT